MSGRQLRQSIEKLRDEIDHSHSLQLSERTELQNLLRALDHRLAEQTEQTELTAAEQQSLTDQLRETLWRFEKSHPTLTVVLGRIIDDLGRMGI